MDKEFESRHPLFAVVDEVTRLSGRFKALFAPARRAVDLSETEMLVLTAVVEATRAPTASQIARSLGIPRQLVQRAVNALASGGLLESAPNPDHKRAVLLLATAEGRAAKREADAVADAIAAAFAGLDRAGLPALADDLRALRRDMEKDIHRRDAPVASVQARVVAA